MYNVPGVGSTLEPEQNDTAMRMCTRLTGVGGEGVRLSTLNGVVIALESVSIISQW